jgi:hypothetical protein
MLIMTKSKIYREPLPLGIVANICQVSRKTILNWIYSDKLKAYTTIGGHNRVWPGDLRAFMDKEGIDVPFIYVETRNLTILCLDYNDQIQKLLDDVATKCKGNTVTFGSFNLYDALLYIGQQNPTLVSFSWTNTTPWLLMDALVNWQKNNPFRLVITSENHDEVETIKQKYTSVANGLITICSIQKLIADMPSLLKHK